MDKGEKDEMVGKQQFKIRYGQDEVINKGKLKNAAKNKSDIGKWAMSQNLRKGLRKEQDEEENKNKASSVMKSKRNSNERLIERSKSVDREKQREEQKKQYSRIPIQYYDERDRGCMADIVKGRVIYRGYAPKNTYFYIKTVKTYNQSQKYGESNSRSDYELKFNSKFECGNLGAACRISSNQYWLYMREDTNTHGLRQWFYFEVIPRKAGTIKFRIYKYSKMYSLYRLGMKPFIRNQKISQDWKQGGQKIKYEYDSSVKGYFLEFQYFFSEENSSVEFATLPPYSYTMLKDYLSTLSRQSYVEVKIIGESLAGLEIPLLLLSNKNKSQGLSPPKKTIVVIARTHPGETVSNFALEGFIQKILGRNEILNYFDFCIIPMVNPDGVFLGNHRTGALGQDLNRKFHLSNLEYFPEIELIHNCIQNIFASKKKIQYFIDLHGHSGRKNIFAYADEYEPNTRSFLMTRIIPKLLSEITSSFIYDFCVFRSHRQKKNTARVLINKKYGINAITFEETYGMLDVGPIGINCWKNFGKSLAEGLLEFAKLYENGGDQALATYLIEQAKIEKQKILKRIEKQKKILGISESLPQIKKKKSFKEEASLTKFKRYQTSLSDRDNVSNSQKEEKQNAQIKKPQKQIDEQSVKSSELSSGDEELEMKDEQVESIKKEIFRTGSLRESYKRQIYSIADKKLEINEWYGKDEYEKLYEQRTSMIPRILKLQMQKKQQYKESIKKEMQLKASLKRDHRVQFPSLK